MASFVFADNARSTLGAAITGASTTITLAAGGGARFPAPAAGQVFALTLNDLATRQVYEVCYCTARAGDVLTVLRGQEGTAATSWAIGDFAWNGPTSGQMNAMVQIPHMTDGSIAPVFSNTVIQGTEQVNGGITCFAGVTASGTVQGGNVGSNNNVVAAGAVFANGGMHPTLFDGYEWTFYDDPSTNDHIQQFRPSWYDRWESATGIRRWAAPSGYIMTLDGVGNLTAAGAGTFGGPVSASGNVTANGGRLRAGFGAFGSGDTNAAAILNDFPLANLPAFGANSYWTRLPNGMIQMMWYDSIDGQTFNQVRNFPFGFPNIAFGIHIQVGSVISSAEGAVFGANPINPSQYQITNAGQVSSGPYSYFATAYGF